MGGIVGYVGERDCEQLLVDALEKLEHRSYDSAGITLLSEDGLERVRSVGNPERMREAVDRHEVGVRDEGGVATLTHPATTGIGHTHWATHGNVTECNAHPHCDSSGRIQIVLNGIVENHLELRRRLEARGVEFSSDTDAELVAHLIADVYHGDLLSAVRRARKKLDGHYAMVAICGDQPGLLVAARKECPLVIGIGDGETFVASAIPAFLDHTEQVKMPEDGDLVELTAGGARFFAESGGEVERGTTVIDWQLTSDDRGGSRHKGSTSSRRPRATVTVE